MPGVEGGQKFLDKRSVRLSVELLISIAERHTAHQQSNVSTDLIMT